MLCFDNLDTIIWYGVCSRVPLNIGNSTLLHMDGYPLTPNPQAGAEGRYQAELARVLAENERLRAAHTAEVEERRGKEAAHEQVGGGGGREGGEGGVVGRGSHKRERGVRGFAQTRRKDLRRGLILAVQYGAIMMQHMSST